jgi:hypothetical protein
MIKSFDWDGHVTVVSMTLSNSGDRGRSEGRLPFAELNHFNLRFRDFFSIVFT